MFKINKCIPNKKKYKYICSYVFAILPFIYIKKSTSKRFKAKCDKETTMIEYSYSLA